MELTLRMIAYVQTLMMVGSDEELAALEPIEHYLIRRFNRPANVNGGLHLDVDDVLARVHSDDCASPVE